MKYKLYRLSFSTAVHFGKGRLGSSDNIFLADRLFSAVCIEALKKSGEDEIEFFCNAVKNGKLLLSDGMPYIGDTYYIPKPVISLERSKDENSSVEKKAFKKLSYIPADKISEFLNGNFDAGKVNSELSALGAFSEKTSAAVHENDDAKPYNVGVYNFASGCGLYFIIGYEDDDIFNKFDDVMYSLGYSGIGGKISAGLGKFDAVPQDVPKEMLDMLNDNSTNVYMTVSVCMAKDGELNTAVEGAEYSIIKRSGFVSSSTYSDTFRKHKDFYCFAGGSSFKNKFEGDVFDISDGGSHPVYRYAKPMFMGVKI